MRKTLIITAALAALTLAACGKQEAAEDKIKASIEESKYALKADERMLADANAKSFFEKQWPTDDKGGKQAGKGK